MFYLLNNIKGFVLAHISYCLLYNVKLIIAVLMVVTKIIIHLQKIIIQMVTKELPVWHNNKKIKVMKMKIIDWTIGISTNYCWRLI